MNWAVQWTADHPDRPVIPIGYSQGGEAASRYRMEFEPGGRLVHLRQNYVCGCALGNPSRHFEHTYFGGPGTPWEGIAVYRLPAVVSTDDWCELIDPGDLYGTCARGLTGEIERDVYDLCTDLQLHDMQQFIDDFIANCIELVGNLDGDAGEALTAGAQRHGVDLSNVNLVSWERLRPLEDKILSVKGIAAAVAAAIDGLIFFCTPPYPTAAHCEYHNREVWPGMTYVGLGIQHVHDWLTTYYQTEVTA